MAHPLDEELAALIKRRLDALHPEDKCPKCGDCERNACEAHQLCYCN